MLNQRQILRFFTAIAICCEKNVFGVTLVSTFCKLYINYISRRTVCSKLFVFLQEVCVNLAMPLGIGAGALVLAIGLLSILFYKCYIEVRPEVARPSTFRDTIKWSFILEDKLVPILLL
jgi:hypothetical protein